MNFIKIHRQELHDCIKKQKSHSNKPKTCDDTNSTNKKVFKKLQSNINNQPNLETHKSEEHINKSYHKYNNRDTSNNTREKIVYRKNSPKIEKFLQKIELQNKKYITQKNSNKTIQKVIEYQFKIAELKDYVFPKNLSKNDSKISYRSSQDSSLASLEDVEIYNLNAQNWKNSFFIDNFERDKIEKTNSRSDKGYVSISNLKKRSHNSSNKNSFINKSSNKNSFCSKTQHKQMMTSPSMTLSIDSKDGESKNVTNNL